MQYNCIEHDSIYWCFNFMIYNNHIHIVPWENFGKGGDWGWLKVTSSRGNGEK